MAAGVIATKFSAPCSLDSNLKLPFQILWARRLTNSTGSHSVKPGFYFFVLSYRHRIFTIKTSFPMRLIRNVLGSRLSACETNPPRAGSNLWGASSNPAPPRRGSQCWPRYGGHTLRERHSLAPRGRRSRQNPHSRTLCFAPEKTPLERRHRNCRIPPQPEAPPLVSSRPLKAKRNSGSNAG